MNERMVTIWDGIGYSQVTESEAEKLVADDKAQNVSDRLVSGTELKYRRQFTGYRTRELRAETKPRKVAKKTTKKKTRAKKSKSKKAK